MFVRIGLVVVAMALLALLSLGIGLGTGYVRITQQGIGWGREVNAPDASASNSNTVSADDLLKEKGVTFVEPQPPAAPPPVITSPPAPQPAVPLATPVRAGNGIVRVSAGSNIPIKDPAGNLWEAANGFDDGEVVDRGKIEIANTRFPELFRYERWKLTSWHCQVPNGKYTVLLHFAETWNDIGGPKQRIFGVQVQDGPIQSIDVFRESGGRRRELIKDAPAVVTDGTLSIKFFPARKFFPFINGIEVIPNGPPDGTSPRVAGSSSATTIRIAAGSTAALRDPQGNTWFADTGFVGGQIADRGRIHVENTDFPEVYRTERYGMSAWRTDLANGTYTIKLHFAETGPSVSHEGQRIFNVLVKDQPLRDFDVYKESGGKNHALVKSFHHVTVGSGRLAIMFYNTGKNVAEINGIEVIPER